MWCALVLAKDHCTLVLSEATWWWPAGHLHWGPVAQWLSCSFGCTSDNPWQSCWRWPCYWGSRSEVVRPPCFGLACSALACFDATAVATRYHSVSSCSSLQDWAGLRLSSHLGTGLCKPGRSCRLVVDDGGLCTGWWLGTAEQLRGREGICSSPNQCPCINVHVLTMADLA